MTPERYRTICDEARAVDARCACCGVVITACRYWQMLRMVIDPMPTEDERLAQRAKEERTRAVIWKP